MGNMLHTSSTLWHCMLQIKEMERLSIGIIFMLENTIIISVCLWISIFHITVEMQLMQRRQFESGTLVKKWVVVFTLPSLKLKAQYIAVVALIVPMFAKNLGSLCTLSKSECCQAIF